eukprot:CAMPEP_0206478772 /NCGR_PEP_ID=MMETSP0324_2-20121206/36273_1 /ASSEMBLY_ACC=CAM_ASM_000836 /TAXON_ID=2866 /ORGANISM="Crypthecodinium cohnii, Strain Seligo" /LENGTH=227 /DNA_ID=CAMNT_0053955183 /DNA_START=131 /DNA_END=811 /DNA_ORIENTATION=-
MGCGASSKATVVEEIDLRQPEQAEVTWATKTKVADDDGKHDSSSTAAATERESSQPPPAETAPAGEMVVVDADLEVEEADQPTPRDSANAQEAPQAADSAPEMQAANKAAQQREREELSQRQKEEAARMAEQRRKFDNQRYQREAAQAEVLSPASRQPGGDSPKRSENPRADMVIGLNLTAKVSADSSQGVQPLEECLPGGIAGDTPRVSPARVMKKNQHDVFDDDD